MRRAAEYCQQRPSWVEGAPIVHAASVTAPRVVLVSRIAGAHISALAIWERAIARLCQKASAVEVADSTGEAGSGPSTSQDGSYSIGAAGAQDLRQPYCFLGLSGVYDITSHLRHEMKRGVEVGTGYPHQQQRKT